MIEPLLREWEAILEALLSGCVPERGLRHIQAGRSDELQKITADLTHVAEGGGRLRFVVGEHGSGKTFFLNLAGEIALRERFVVTYAGFTKDRLLVLPSGQARARAFTFYLMRNMATRSKPGGGALAGIIERFISETEEKAHSYGIPIEVMLYERLDDLVELAGGSDFIQAIITYWRGHEQGNWQHRADALRWLRVGFSSNAESQHAMGVDAMDHHGMVADHLALWGRFVRCAGYSGLAVCLDDLVHLYRLPDPGIRDMNYSELQRMLIHAHQGMSNGLYVLAGGPPEVFMDTRKGLFSVPQLRAQLMESRITLADSFLQLRVLTSRDLFVFFRTIRDLFVKSRPLAGILPDAGIRAFMDYCALVLGDQCFRRPRAAIANFAQLLLLLEKNPRVPWQQLVSSMKIELDCMPHLKVLPACL